MSIQLQDVHKTVFIQGKPHKLLDGLNVHIERGARVGVLGLPKSGKSTLLRIICGTERTDSGRIYRDMTVSWPIPLADFLVPHSSIAWNIRSVARLYGITDDSFPRRIGEMAGIAEYLNLPLSKCPPFARPQLVFALGIGMNFDLYLFDNQVVPQRKEFREDAVRVFRERTLGRAIVVAAGKPDGVVANCDSAYVLEDGRATYFAKVEEAAAHFKTLLQAEMTRLREAQEQQRPGDDSEDNAREEVDRAMDMAVSAEF